jgi:hypothetical protein
MSKLILPGDAAFYRPDLDLVDHEANGDAHHTELHEAAHRSGGGDELSHANLAALTTGDPHTQYVLGSALGSWQAWSPSYTNLTVGNGTVVARYTEVGKLVVAWWELVWGTTTSIDAGNPLISMPVTASSSYTATRQGLGNAVILDSGTATYTGLVRLESTTNFSIASLTANSHTGTVHIRRPSISATSPHTFGDGDFIGFTATYEAA